MKKAKLSIKEYRELKPKSKSHYPGAYACPVCWTESPYSKMHLELKRCTCRCGNMLDPTRLIYFASKVECGIGSNLKAIESEGKITKLQRQKNILLLPKVWIKKYEQGPISGIVTAAVINGKLFDMGEMAKKYIKKEGYIMVHPAKYYRADFTFFEGDHYRVIEVKNTTAKKNMDGTMETAIYYGKGQSENALFRTTRLLKLIYSVDLEVYAGGQVWKFNEKGRLSPIGGIIQ